jgi:hypothetical protein
MTTLGLGGVEVLGGGQIPRLGRIVDVGLIWIEATGIAGGRIVFVGHFGAPGSENGKPKHTRLLDLDQAKLDRGYLRFL